MTRRPALAPIRSLGRDARGVSAIEFALIAPVMILIYCALAELSSGLMAARKTDHALSTLADLIGQTPQNMTGAQMGPQLASVMTGAQDMMTPFGSPALQIRAMSVSVRAGGTIQVDWDCIGSGTTDPGIPLVPANQIVVQAGGAPATFQGMPTSQSARIYTLLTTAGPTGAAVLADPGTSVIVAQGDYHFSSPISNLLPATLTFGDMFFTRPRNMSEIPSPGNYSSGVQCNG